MSTNRWKDRHDEDNIHFLQVHLNTSNEIPNYNGQTTHTVHLFLKKQTFSLHYDVPNMFLAVPAIIISLTHLTNELQR